MTYAVFILSLLLSTIQIPDLSLKRPKWRPWTILIISIAVCVISIVEAVTQERADFYKQNHGVLDGSLSSRKKKIPIMSIGEGGAEFMIGYGNKGFSPDIDLWIENDELFLTTTLRAPNGEVMAHMVANRWKINRNNIFDRNFDKRSIEIKNNRNQVVLQVIYTGEKAQISGVFYDKKGVGMALYYDTALHVSLIKSFEPADEPDINIKPLFRYPSEDFPGERVKN